MNHFSSLCFGLCLSVDQYNIYNLHKKYDSLYFDLLCLGREQTNVRLIFLFQILTISWHLAFKLFLFKIKIKKITRQKNRYTERDFRNIKTYFKLKSKKLLFWETFSIFCNSINSENKNFIYMNFCKIVKRFFAYPWILKLLAAFQVLTPSSSL